MTTRSRFMFLAQIVVVGVSAFNAQVALANVDSDLSQSSRQLLNEPLETTANTENRIPDLKTINEYIAYFNSPSPWGEIRKKRIKTLLPLAMKNADLRYWLIVCRENNNDPLANHVGCENAGGTAVILFSLEEDVAEEARTKRANAISSRIFSPTSESTALKELGTFDYVVDVSKGESAVNAAATWMAKQQIKGRVGINSFSVNPFADGLSHSQYLMLEKAFKNRDVSLVSAEDVIYYWLARKLPEEVDIMEKAAAITSRWEYEAYQMVKPGITTDKDIAGFLKQKMAEAGVTDGWAESQNPAVNSGPDRGHSHPTERVIQGGDVIQIDFGIRVFEQWVTDVQRFAYVLNTDEQAAPQFIQHAWESAIAGRNAAFNTMKPGVSGNEVHKAQLAVMQKNGSLPVMWSTGHPVGYVAHDVGPNLGVRPASDKLLDTHMTFAFDGFFSWPYNPDEGDKATDVETDSHSAGNEKNNVQKTKTISVEDMVVITEQGARFLTAPQTSLVVVGH